ncbi:MAG: hypothetical protein AAF843_18740, partial [Bacteroidota bacterium]
MIYSTECLNGLGAFPAALVPVVANIAGKVLGSKSNNGSIKLNEVNFSSLEFTDAVYLAMLLYGIRNNNFVGHRYDQAVNAVFRSAPFEMKSYISKNAKREGFWKELYGNLLKIAEQNAANQGNPFAIAASTGQKASNVIDSQIAQVNNPPAINQTASPSISTRAGFGG